LVGEFADKGKQQNEMNRTAYSCFQHGLYFVWNWLVGCASEEQDEEILRRTIILMRVGLFTIILVSWACGGFYNRYVLFTSALLIVAALADTQETFIRQALFLIVICYEFQRLSVPETPVIVPHSCNTSTNAVDPLCVLYTKDIFNVTPLFNVTVWYNMTLEPPIGLVCARIGTWEDLYRQSGELEKTHILLKNLNTTLTDAHKKLQSLSTQFAKAKRKLGISTKKMALIRWASYGATCSAVAGVMGAWGVLKTAVDTTAFTTIITLSQEPTGEETVLESIIMMGVDTPERLPFDMPTAQKIPPSAMECFVTPYTLIFTGVVSFMLYALTQVESSGCVLLTPSHRLKCPQ